MKQVSLSGPRLSLTLSRGEDQYEAQEVLAFYLRNDHHLSPWDPEKPKEFFTLDYWQHWLDRAYVDAQKEQAIRFLLRQNSDQRLLGFASFTNIERGHFQNCRLGYKLDHEFQGQGLMTEALRLGIDFVFEELNLHRIEANYIPRNLASGRVLEKLGFEKHGVAKNYLKINGKWEDHVLTSLVKTL
jgi:ribosomal-protein-alanine N-acetyltransferase